MAAVDAAHSNGVRFFLYPRRQLPLKGAFARLELVEVSVFFIKGLVGLKWREE